MTGVRNKNVFFVPVKYPIFQVDIGGNFAIKPNSLSAGGKAKVDRYSGGLQVKGDIDNPKAGDYNVAIEVGDFFDSRYSREISGR